MDFIDHFIDAMFLIDIILSFNTAILTDDMVLIDKRKDIAIYYVKSWFLIDVIACIPFDELINS